MSNKRKNINCLVLGYYGAKNLGDDLMLEAIIGWLTKQNRRVTVISENVEDTKSRFQVACISNAALLFQWGWVGTYLKGKGYSLLKALFKADELFVGGGDLIRDTMGWRTFWYTVEKMLLALLLGKKVYLINVGIGVPTKKYSKKILRYVLSRCEFIVVRDNRSLELCNELGVKHVKIAPDIATALSEKYYDKETRHSKKENNKYCLVTLRTSPNVYHGYDIGNEHYKGLAEALDSLVENKNLDIIFVPFQSLKDNDDNSVHKVVYDFMKHKGRATIEDWNSSSRKLFEKVAEAQLVIGMRLHTAIVAISVESRCVVMPYDKKVDGFNKLSGVKHVLLPGDLSDSARAIDIINGALENKVNYCYDQLGSWDDIKL